ncbi:TBCC-domain-containing protein, partial [Neolentinus lepideus HHB14362 ss-1]
EQVQGITQDLVKVRKELTDATGYLPSYDQRQYESQLNSIEGNLEELRAASAPKAKFSFRRKATKASTPTTTPNAIAPTPSFTSTEVPPTAVTAGLSIASRSYTYLTAAELGNVQATDLTISDLDHCILNLVTPVGRSFSAIHVRNITHCVLLLGQVNGSVLLHDLRRCVLVLSCHQFRMHTSKDTDVYLSIPSNPVIEHCSGIRFSPFPKSLPNLTESSAWVRESKHLFVQDFSQIKPTSSPNWSELPPERVIQQWPVQPEALTALELFLPPVQP